MDVSVLPSQFLSVVLEEPSKKKIYRKTKNAGFPNLISDSVIITPVTPKTKLNGKYSHHQINQRMRKGSVRNSTENDKYDLTKHFPPTVLEECIVKITNPSSQKSLREKPQHMTNGTSSLSYGNHSKGRKPKDTDKCLDDDIDIRDIMTRVEAVYSDDDNKNDDIDDRDNGDEEFADDKISKKSVSNGYNNVNGSDSYTGNNLDELSFACEYCPNKYSNKGALWQHSIATHSAEKTCECPLCGRKFYRNCSLALHMKCHSDEQNCSCMVCGKQFSRMSVLEKHLKNHKDSLHNKRLGDKDRTRKKYGDLDRIKKRFGIKDRKQKKIGIPDRIRKKYGTQASVQKKILDQDNTQNHVLSPPEKHSCELCNITFNRKQLLELHFDITHNRGKLPFICKLCKARFGNLKDLLEHNASHTSEKLQMSCQKCGETFVQKAAYKKHLQTHSTERLSCEICKIDFTQRSSLLRHHKKLHGITVPPVNSNTTNANTASYINGNGNIVKSLNNNYIKSNVKSTDISIDPSAFIVKIG